MKQKTKILVIGPCPKKEASGAGLGFDSLLDGLRQRRIPFVTVDLSPQGLARQSGVFCWKRIFHSLFCILSAWGKLPFCRTLYMTISLSWLGFCRDAILIQSAHFLKRTIILHLKGGGYDSFYAAQPAKRKKRMQSTLSKADRIIALGNRLKDQFDFVSGHEEKIRIVHNGLPRDLQPPSSSPKTLPPNGEPVRLLYLSNLIDSKGYLQLLEACAILKNKGLLFCCDFCGSFVQTLHDQGRQAETAKEKKFLDRIDALKLTEQVRFHGTVHGTGKQQMLEQAHLFILPTRYPWEGQPISIIEALAFGIPVISTNYRGIPEQVEDGYNGYLLSSQEPGEIAERILRIIEDPAKYSQFSRHALDRFESCFTREKHLEDLIAVLLQHDRREQDRT